MEVILLKDVDKVGPPGRGRERRPRLRPQLPPAAQARRAGHDGPRDRAEEERGPARPQRGRARSSRRTRSPTCSAQAELSFDVKSGPTGALFGSVTTTDIADRIWADHKIRVDRKKIETDSIRRIGRYSVPIQLFENVTVEVKTLVVPEGGELPPEEELAAMEAAEAEVQAAAQAEAEAHRAEAEAALEVELERRAGGSRQQTPAEAAAAAGRRAAGRARSRGRGEPSPRPRDGRARGDRASRKFSTACSTGLWSVL